MEYKGRFYSERSDKTEYAADKILSIVFDCFDEIELNTVIDVGCGVGAWLRRAEREGALTTGIEGDWIPEDLYVANGRLIKSNLSESLPKLDQVFDLCINLEVAEHLPESRAQYFVDELTRYSSIILFGAAPPGQGGKGHVNEQPLSYWIEKFKNKNYVMLDIVRAKVWNDKNIPFWYRQNTVIFVESNYLKSSSVIRFNDPVADVIHPELFELYRFPRVYISFLNILQFPIAFLRTIKRRLYNK